MVSDCIALLPLVWQSRLALRIETLSAMENRTTQSQAWSSSLAPDQVQLDAASRSVSEIRAEIVKVKGLISTIQVRPLGQRRASFSCPVFTHVPALSIRLLLMLSTTNCSLRELIGRQLWRMRGRARAPPRS